jgi:hypothetical protein
MQIRQINRVFTRPAQSAVQRFTHHEGFEFPLLGME